MSRVTRREWYRRANACWPAQVPDLTAEEAERAARRLYRFVTRRTWTGRVKVSSGNRYTKIWSSTIVVNPDRGWRSLVHQMSHRLEGYAGTRGHNAKHARLEMRMIKEVVRRGWLDGKLKAAPKAPKPQPDVRALRKARTEAAIGRWEAKKRRAEAALRKLRKRLRYYERRGEAMAA